MKKLIVKCIHHLFKTWPAERALLFFTKDAFVGSFTSRLVPPNTSYPNPTHKVARQKGYTVKVNLNDYNDWKLFWGLKEVEREELYKLAKGARNIVDIGDNNGWVMINLATIARANNGRVFGFEPHPQTFERSYKNLTSNGITNAELYNLGCGDAAAELTMMNVKSSNSGQNRIVSAQEAAQNETNSTKVKVVLLDEHLRDIEHIDLIKIDVEGFEKKVLQGAIGILKKDKPVLFIELDDALLKKNQSSAADLVGFLADLEYSIVDARTGSEVLTTGLDACHFDIICK